MNTLMVNAEHGTTGVWLDGAPVDDLCALGFSGELNADFHKWSTRFTDLSLSIVDDSYDPRWIQFNQDGRELAKRLKRECKERFKVECRYYADNSYEQTTEVLIP